MSRERSEGKTGIGGSRRVGSALFEKNIISVEYVKLKLLVALFAAIYLSVPHLSHAAPVDELLDVPVRVVGPDGNDVPGAELLFRGDNLGVTSDKWIPAPQTMHLVNRDGFLVNARGPVSGAQRYLDFAARFPIRTQIHRPEPSDTNRRGVNRNNDSQAGARRCA